MMFLLKCTVICTNNPRRQDTRRNDTHHNDIQQNDAKC